MFTDWSGIDYGRGLIADKPRLRRACGRGRLTDVDYPRTRFGRGYVKVTDQSRTELGHGLTVDIARLRTVCGHGRFAVVDSLPSRLRSWTGQGRGLTAGWSRTRIGRGRVRRPGYRAGNFA